MAETIEQNELAAARQRSHNCEIGHVSSREKQRTLATSESSELFLQARVLDTVPSHQVRGAATCPVPTHGFAHRRSDFRVAGEPQIVVAAEVNKSAACDHHLRPTAGLRPRLDRVPLAPQALAIDLRKRGFKRAQVAFHDSAQAPVAHWISCFLDRYAAL